MIINCPHCSGVLMKTKQEQVTSIEMSFRCPHCKRDIECKIQIEIVVIVNGKRIEHLGEQKIRTI